MIAQAYEADNPSGSAPSNKAADLNTAMSWLLNNNWASLPDRLKSAAEQLQNAIRNNQISRSCVWYVHNFPESSTVKSELQNVERTAKSSLTANFPDANIEIQATEVGRSQLEDWYQAISAPILVSRDIFVHNVRGYEMNGSNCECSVASIPVTVLYELFEENQTKLFSANIRDY